MYIYMYITYMYMYKHDGESPYILVKVPCECITGNIARDPTPSAIFSIMHERERYFNWFIEAAFLASVALNKSKWALRSKLLPTRSRGKTGEPL